MRITLRRVTSVSSQTLESLEELMAEGYLKSITIYGVDSKNLCRAQLQLKFDWDEYQLQVEAGKATVAIDEKWKDDTAIEVDEAILLFNRFVKSQSLTTECQWYYTSSANRNELNRKYGFTTASPLKWAGKSQGIEYQIEELPELRVGCYLLEDDE